ncbi:MAG: ABC transporter transmembrane domain-containing protein [Marmoricola sp.]
MQERIDEVNRSLREQITGVRVVRAFVREERETMRFAVANDELTEVSIRAGRWMAGMFPTVMLVANLSTIGVLWFGGHRVEAGHMESRGASHGVHHLSDADRDGRDDGHLHDDDDPEGVGACRPDC